MTPRVSVLLPVRNGMRWLGDSLASLSGQTFGDFEIIALEDGSTDDTPQFLAAWPDPRLRVIQTGGVGIAAALTAGLEAARAALIARQDADDLSAPERLRAQVEYLDCHPGVALVACNADYIDEDGLAVDNSWVRTIRRQQDGATTPDLIRELMPLTCCITHGSIVARAAVLRAAGGYRQDTAPAEDYDLWLRLLPIASLAKLPQRLYQYRVHGEQVSARAKDEQIRRTIAAKLAHVRRVCPELPHDARLAIVGSGSGDEYYRAVAPQYGFRVLPGAHSGDRGRVRAADQGSPRRAAAAIRSCDALAVTDFSALDECTEAIRRDEIGRDAVRVGNIFVARRRLSSVA
jgi:glycosyltransferase involved in cell wall biosynthesis